MLTKIAATENAALCRDGVG